MDQLVGFAQIGWSFLIFFTRPISAVFIGLTYMLIITLFLSYFIKKKEMDETSKEHE